MIKPRLLKHRQIERWLARQKQKLASRWLVLREQMLTATWSERCARLKSLPDANLQGWQPHPGSSSAELALLLQPLPLLERQLLASLLDASAAGPLALTEAVERLELEWRQRLDPRHSHRQYAAQLESLAGLLGVTPAARSAYLDNEQKIVPAIDRLLFDGLPIQLRSTLASRYDPGTGAYLDWWHGQLLMRAGVRDYAQDNPGVDEWPELPPAWLALGWICRLRSGSVAMGKYSSA